MLRSRLVQIFGTQIPTEVVDDENGTKNFLIVFSKAGRFCSIVENSAKQFLPSIPLRLYRLHSL